MSDQFKVLASAATYFSYELITIVRSIMQKKIFDR